MSVWEKHLHGWLRRSPRPDSGVVDFMINSLCKIVKDNDTSEWAFNSFLFNEQLLQNGYRWPKEFGETYGDRVRTDLTWDCYVGYVVGAKFFKQPIAVKPKWYLWPPVFWIWWFRLEKYNKGDSQKRLDFWKAYTHIAGDNFYE